MQVADVPRNDKGQLLPGSVISTGLNRLGIEYSSLRRMAYDEFKECAEMVIGGKQSELVRLKNDPNVSTAVAWMASVALKAIQKGEAHHLEILFNRIYGPVKQKVEVSGSISVAPASREETQKALATDKFVGDPIDAEFTPSEEK